MFPQMDQQDGKRDIGWSPGFQDYLFVSFTTSSTFGPTDTPVLSGRVKILTVIQALLSLVVVIVLVAWAVGTLWSQAFIRSLRPLDCRGLAASDTRPRLIRTAPHESAV